MTKIIQTFTDFGNRKWRDRLDGGKADGKTPEDFPDEDISIGRKVQREHTSNPDIATEIAMDHLSEDPDYYDKLIAAGITDEQDAIDTFDKLKGKNARLKAKLDIKDYMEDNDFDEEDFDEEDFDEEDTDDIDYDDDNDVVDYREDKLGSDKVDYDDDDELIIDDDEPKKNYNIMEKKLLKNYKTFLKESNETPSVPPMDEPAPRRMYSPENKSKVQIAYDESLLQGLEDHLLAEAGDSTPPTPNSFIILDFKDDKYKIVPEPVKGIRVIQDIEEQFYKDL